MARLFFRGQNNRRNTYRADRNNLDGLTAYGGNQTDWIYGTNGNDSIEGLEGNDFLFGNDGWDVLHGGHGNDFLVVLG